MVNHAGRVHPAQAVTQLRRLAELAVALAHSGRIPHPGWMWYLDPDSLGEPGNPKEKASRRIGVTTWDPFIYEVITNQGDAVTGYPVAPGWGVGRLRWVDTAEEAARSSPREVITAAQPLNNLAPLLWDAAGLVTIGGGPGAHLFEVAGWLGVPAVCGVDLTGLSGTLMAAVDGDSGRISLLPSG